MNKVLGLIICIFLMLFTSPSYSLVIEDNYIGGYLWNGTIYEAYLTEDVIGRSDQYGISKMEVDITNGEVKVKIFSDYFDNIGIGDTQLGDFFISTDDWTPFGNEPYTSDVITNGEDWEYVFVLDDHLGTKGKADLYEVDESRLISAYNTYGYRPGQEVLYNTEGQEAEKTFAHWWIDDIDNYMLITFNNSILGLTYDDYAFRWSMSCANDVIEGGSAPVPEPATLLLFGTGLVGLARIRFKNKGK